MLLRAVDIAGDFVPAHITGTAVAPDGAWEAIVDPGLLRPGTNTIGVFAVRDHPDGSVMLAEAHAGGGERPTINLVRDTAVKLVGVTAGGFHATEWAEGRAVGTGRRCADDLLAERSPDHRGRRLCPF